MWLISVLCACLIGPACSVSREKTMYIENNQFKNMVIAINDNVAENKVLIEKLKTTMTEASQVLFTGTRQRAYFKQITILLPASWSDDVSYSRPVNESYRLADVLITNPARTTRSAPQTRSYSGCGQQGVHMLLTEEFLTNQRVAPYFNAAAKFFVHAFAQFRWGVFQEYAEDGETAFYFSLTSGRSEAIRCVYAMRGLIQKNDANRTICYSQFIDQETGLYPPDCLWRPYPTRQRVEASMMDQQFIQAITKFCDDDDSGYMTVHNYESPSKHNRLCGHRSTWDVITNSDDFKNNVNPPVTGSIGNADLKPTFKIVRATARKRRAVVVMDTDGSSDSYERTEKAISEIHHTAKRQDADVEIIHNNNNYGKRDGSGGEGMETSGTDMSKGIVASRTIEKVLRDEESLSGSTLTVLTDGLTAQNSMDISILSKAVDRGMDVNVIVLNGSNTTQLQTITHIPGVKMCYEGSHPDVNNLHDCLHVAMSGTLWRQEEHAQISRFNVEVPANQTIEKEFTIDQLLGRRTSVVIEYESEIPEVTLRTPRDKLIGIESEQCQIDHKFKIIRFFFEKSKRGKWTVSIRSKQQQNVTVSVKSMSKDIKKADPIVVQPQVVTMETNGMTHLALYVDVTQGVNPVVGLNVTALVADPQGQVHTLQMLDSGTGADITKDDGVYSRYFTRLDSEGLYHVTIQLKGDDGKTFAREVSLNYEDLHSEDGPRLTKITNDLPLQGGLERRVYGGDYVHRVTREATHVGTRHSDRIPPSRIADCVVKRIIRYRKTFVLSWTAPGDDLDHGKVKGYQLFVGEGVKDVRSILKAARGDWQPTSGTIRQMYIRAIADAGNEESHLWKVKDTASKSIAFAVRAVDAAGNVGDISNVATSGWI